VSEVQELQGLVRRLDALVAMRTMKRNRLGAGKTFAAERTSITAHVPYLPLVGLVLATSQSVRQAQTPRVQGSVLVH
jgi:hypothetical protein